MTVFSGGRIMWSKLGIRLFSALVGAAGLIGIILFAPVWAFNLLVATASVISLYEISKALGLNQKPQTEIIKYIAALAVFYVLFSDGALGEKVLAFIFVAYIMLLMIFAVVFNKTVKFSDVPASVFALFYSVVFLAHISLIRGMENGTALVFLPLLGAWMPDTFAYFSGMLFGKHKLIPSVSPNKTVEGAIGAVVGCVLMFMLYGFIAQNIGFSVNYTNLVILSVISSVLAQFGDLSASIIKRSYGIKDFGNLIPGHGGIMDRIDSLIFIAPVTYYFLLLMPIIG